MIYLVGTAHDVKALMRDRPLLDLVQIKLIRTPDDVKGLSISEEDEIVYGHAAWQMGFHTLSEIRGEIKMAQIKAQANAERSER
jgi:hypothetical protein